jgi:Holliday junction DNA helicase RuvA
MIAKLTGVVDTIDLDALILDVNGVGYHVLASNKTLARLVEGQQASLLIEPLVRQEQTLLYGFSDIEERQWFRLLLTVQGVGGKVGLALLSALTTDELLQAIASQDATAICRADGVGPKLANRIVSELKDKIPTVVVQPIRSVNVNLANQEALSALLNLGYRRAEAAQALCDLETDAHDTGTLIRLALQRLAQARVAHG